MTGGSGGTMADMINKQKEMEAQRQEEARQKFAARAKERNMQRTKADPGRVGNNMASGMQRSHPPRYDQMQNQPPMRMSGPPGRQRPPVRPYHAGPTQRHYQPQMQRPKPPPFDFFTILQDGELFGKVRKVMSGDYLFIEILRQNKPKGEPREFKRVTLSEIIAPRIAKKDDQFDVLFAWESREFLRRLLIHSIVILKLEKQPEANSKNPPRGRGLGEFGTVLFRPDVKDEEITADRSVWVDIAEILVRRGMVEVKGGASGERADALRQIQADAQASLIGKWEKKPADVRKGDRSWSQRHHREVEWSPDPETIFKEYHGKPVKAIIEDVREGSCVRCEILVSDRPIKTKIIWLELSGVECPKTPKPERVQRREHKGKKQDFVLEKPKPFAEQAKMETMIRLLHRDVDIVIEAIDAQKNLYGTVTFHRGDKRRDISNYLLMNGLAKVVPWTAKLGGSNRLETFRNLERVAKTKKKHIWSLEENQSPSSVGERRTGIVVEVTSGDSFLVKDEGSDEPPQRFFLASVQAPRNIRNRRRGQPFFYEAKEFVRRALIQKRINYELEYVRNPNLRGRDANETFQYVTVTYGNGQNLNHEMVSRGYARVVPHRKRESRSKDYVSLLDAEKDAKLHDLGIHSPESTHVYLDDFTILPQKPRKKKGKADEDDANRQRKMDEYQKEFQSFLKRAKGWAAKHELCETEAAAQERRSRDSEARARARAEGKDFKSTPPPKPKTLPAVVEYVHAADRIKVQLQAPGPQAILNLILSGIDVKGNGTIEKKVIDEANSVVKKMLTQQEVKVEIEKIDRNANFIGNLFAPDGTDLSIFLLSQGYAKIFARQGQRGPANVRPALRKAEEKARDNNDGCWENYVPPAPKKEEEEDVEGAEANGAEGGRGSGRRPQGDGGPRRERKRRERRPERAKEMKVQVANLTDCVTFYARNTTDPQAKIIETYMRNIDPATATFNFEIERGLVVAGLYEQDGQFYRCKLLNKGPMVDGVRTWRCDWIDFGERGEVKETGIISIDDITVRERPPLAMKFILAGLKPPPENSVYYSSSTLRFWEEICGKDLDVKILRQNKNDRYCIVNIEGEPVNDKLLRDGVLRVHEGRQMREEPAYKEHLMKLQAEAKEAHVGLWQFGDLGSDDEDDDRRGGRGGRR